MSGEEGHFDSSLGFVPTTRNEGALMDGSEWQAEGLTAGGAGCRRCKGANKQGAGAASESRAVKSGNVCPMMCFHPQNGAAARADAAAGAGGGATVSILAAAACCHALMAFEILWLCVTDTARGFSRR